MIGASASPSRSLTLRAIHIGLRCVVSSAPFTTILLDFNRRLQSTPSIIIDPPRNLRSFLHKFHRRFSRVLTSSKFTLRSIIKKYRFRDIDMYKYKIYILFSFLSVKLTNVYVSNWLSTQGESIDVYIMPSLYGRKLERQVRWLTQSHVNPSTIRTSRNNVEDINDLRAALQGWLALHNARRC